MSTSNKYILIALIIGLLIHGSTMFFTIESTYDALIHLFFANHYLTQWFEPWDTSWYTGFTVLGYPPLVHQSIAFFAFLGGLKFGLYVLVILGVILFTTGVYRFSLMITSSREYAGLAAIVATLSSSFIETLHIFGQLPSIIGISLLLHTLPSIYRWLYERKVGHLIMALSLMAVTVTSHHVTPIFGMVFFIFPVIGLVLMDLAKDRYGSYKKVRFTHFLKVFYSNLRPIIVFGMGSLLIIITCILPYWINTKNNPITQVPIPHGSRDNFLEITSSGFVFFIIPWGFLFILFPFIFYRFYSKRLLFFGLSFSMLLLLGSGGTTPLPKMLLGDNAFNILTLDRFTLWGSIMALPLFGEFIGRFSMGDIKVWLQKKVGPVIHRSIGGVLLTVFLSLSVFTMCLGYFRPSQPQKIDMLPIVNFLNQDEHYRWRYLTLGFGDQMAYLSTLTKATTVDGNYHSARRLPELTSRAVERLENSKYRGVEGLGSLQQFLAVPSKYHLKYLFSNDKFYDPLLFFMGWQKLQQLENGIMVWEKPGIKPLPAKLYKEFYPKIIPLMWGIIPMTTVFIALLLNIRGIVTRTFRLKESATPPYYRTEKSNSLPAGLFYIEGFWTLLVLSITAVSLYWMYLKTNDHRTPEQAVFSYYNSIDFKEFEKAHELLSPSSNKSLDQYLLEISVSDGLLSSYGKLDKIEAKVIEEGENHAIVAIENKWVTPLKNIDEIDTLLTVKENNKWYVVPKAINVDLPPDQFLEQKKLQFDTHGKRKISTNNTFHEDILPRPDLAVLTSKLIVDTDEVHIIGIVQNISNLPAHISVEAQLFKNSELLAQYGFGDVVKYNLLPKEQTPFRISFERIAWVQNDEKLPKVFDPDEQSPFSFEILPDEYILHFESNISTKNHITGLEVNELRYSGKVVSGTLMNHTVDEATVPQLLVSCYDENNSLSWVDCYYVEEAIRSQRGKKFDFQLPANRHEILGAAGRYFINGIEQSSAVSQPVTQLYSNQMKIQPMDFNSISITINGYQAKAP